MTNTARPNHRMRQWKDFWNDLDRCICGQVWPCPLSDATTGDGR